MICKTLIRTMRSDKIYLPQTQRFRIIQPPIFTDISGVVMDLTEPIFDMAELVGSGPINLVDAGMAA